MDAGANSVIYRGDNMLAAPIPKPPMNRAMVNSVRLLGKAEAIPEMPNRMAVTINTFFRPHLSLAPPANMAPKIQPTIAEEAAHPFIDAVNSNFVSKSPITPEMTAVS